MSVDFGFQTLLQRGAARVGRLSTPHGGFETPAFVAVGTKAAVRSLDPDDLRAVGQPALFCNTYHLYLRPGHETVAALGGLHAFMAWDGPIMTDSGGFQVFSLGASLAQGVGKIGGGSIFPGEAGAADPEAGAAPAPRRVPAGLEPMVDIDEEGVRFRSHLDGSVHRFTAESSIAIQRDLGADIVLAFDECTSPLHDHAYTAEAMARTHRWAERSLSAFHAEGPRHGARQALYGIVQGGWFEDLRVESARAIAALPFDGIAIGGSLGRTKAEMHRVLELTVPLLGEDRPRHLLGIGEIPDIFEAVARGVDTFDCVGPTRMARNAGLLVPEIDGERPPKLRMNMRNARYARDPRPVLEGCPCLACRRFSRGYLRHLYKVDELLAFRLGTLHNLTVINGLMADIRGALRQDRLPELRARWLG